MPRRLGPNPEETRDFCWERLEDPGKYDRRSFRTTHPRGRPEVNIVTGCPDGYWDDDSEMCEVSREAQTIGHRLSAGGPCPRGCYEIVDRRRTGGRIVKLTSKSWSRYRRVNPKRRRTSEMSGYYMDNLGDLDDRGRTVLPPEPDWARPSPWVESISTTRSAPRHPVVRRRTPPPVPGSGRQTIVPSFGFLAAVFG